MDPELTSVRGIRVKFSPLPGLGENERNCKFLFIY